MRRLLLSFSVLWTVLLSLLAQEAPAAKFEVLVQEGVKEVRISSRENMNKPPFLIQSRIKAPIGITHYTNAPINFESYGEVISIFKENFSKMGSGSEAAPDVKTNVILPQSKYPWVNVDPKYTDKPGWGGHAIYPAGGKVYMGAKLPSSGTAWSHINTCMIDLSQNEGVALLRFRMRASRAKQNNENVHFLAEGAETFNMEPAWRPTGTYPIDNISTEWKTYEFLFKDCGKHTIFNLPMEATGDDYHVFIDNIEVLQCKSHVKTPSDLQFSDYKGRSFRLSWKSSDKPDHYLLNVYKLVGGNPQQGIAPKRVNLLENQRVEGTSYEVTGGDSGEIYYYTVTAVKGEHKSFESLLAQVDALEKPVIKNTPVKDKHFTASWEQVPGAGVYNYSALHERFAKEDGAYTVTKEDFKGVTDPDGSLTGLTKEEPSSESVGIQNIKQLKQAGWVGYNYRAYTDYVTVDGFHWVSNGRQSGLVSPEFDLSKDGGRITVGMKLAGETNKVEDENGQQIDLTTEALVALFNFNEETGKFDQVEQVYCKELSIEWKDVEVILSKGSKRSIIGVFAVTGPGNLYIDDLKITQVYKKGESLIEPFFFELWHKENIIDVKMSNLVADHNVYHYVKAIKAGASPFGEGMLVGVESPNSDMVQVQKGAYTPAERPECIVEGIKDISYSVEGLKLNIGNPKQIALSIISMEGIVLYSAPEGRSSISFGLPAKGTYLISSGAESVKIVL